jgi:hypothetical protein
MTTTLDELLNMMHEDAARAVRPEKRPPPVPPKKAESIKKEELESLDDGPVLKGELWPSALPRPARRGPPPPPPGRRARGTEPVTSGLIDVRAMAMAYAAEAARRAGSEPPESDLAEASTTVVLPLAEPEALPPPIIAEGTRPFAAPEVVEPEKAPTPKATTWRSERFPVWPLIARRAGIAVVVVALGATAASALLMMIDRTRSAGAAGDPTETIARVERATPAPVAELPAPEPAIEPVIIVQPTTITEVREGEPVVVDDEASPVEPAVAAEPEGGPGRGVPPPELLADGCFDAACGATLPRVRRPARPASEMISVPARLPLRPSNSEIASTMFSAQDQIEGCGAAYGMTGQVPIKIKIAESGAITQVAVGQGTTRFRTCVADIVRRLKMPASVVGTTASFPILIR